MAKLITSVEVAARAGVSQSTVSRVFSDSGSNVTDDTRHRVLAAAQELGYRPNAIARMMSTRRTNIIGIVMANITSPFYPYVLEKFLQRLQALDRQALLFTPAPNQDVDDILPLVLAHRVDGLIITSATLSSEMAEECAKSGTPVVLFNRYVPGAHVSAVCADNVDMGRRIADLLLDLGCQRLGYVAGTPNTSTNTDREHSFYTRLDERGAAPAVRAQGDFTYESGYAAAYELLTLDSAPDALFCANDIMALGALDAAHRLGRRVPDDVSIVGVDDIPMSSWAAYDLTTISQEVDLMIEVALTLLMDKLDDPQQPPQTRFIPGVLKVRGSVRGLKRDPEGG